jgi:hypothetical protein
MYATSKDDAPPRLGGWTDGENNMLRSTEIPDNALRRCVNYDVTDGGSLIRRAGYQKIVSGSIEPGSLFAKGNMVLFVESGTLYQLQPETWNKRVIRANIGTGRIAYLALNGLVYWTNGITSGVADELGHDAPWGVKRPDHQPEVTGSSTGGSLQPGEYQVAVTHCAPSGEESGTEIAELVTVAGDGSGSIVLTGFAPASDGAPTANIYASSADGEQLYKVGETLTGSLQYQITAVDNQQGRQLDTQFADTPPVGTALAYHNGRIYIADGSTVWCTLPLRYGLVDQAVGMLMFPADVTVMAAVADGLYICADKTYWLTDIDTDQFQQRAVLPYGAVTGTVIDIPLSDNVAWFSVQGIIVAGLSGQVASVQEDKSAVGDFQSGAMLFRNKSGLRQIIASLADGEESPLLATDYQQLETARKGNAL